MEQLIEDLDGPLVYVIEAQGDGLGLYKIGYTKKTLSKRLRGIKTGCPFSIEPVLVYQSDIAKKVETVLHRTFKPWREDGEWYRLPDDYVLKLKETIEQIDSNLKTVMKDNTWYQQTKTSFY